MSDLISRQAAIAAVSNWLYDRDDGRSVDQLLSTLPSVQPLVIHCTDCEDWLERQSILGFTISELPSAQPGIIRCKDCKHRDPEDKKCDCGHDILWQLPRDDNWFCADAERRTDE